jgi:hypothetical protein
VAAETDQQEAAQEAAMAFITRESPGGADDTIIPPSFMTTNDSDPFDSVVVEATHCPDAKRNILDDLNRAESTMLPPPPDKESVAVFLRVKPTTEREREITKEMGGSEVSLPSRPILPPCRPPWRWSGSSPSTRWLCWRRRTAR